MALHVLSIIPFVILDPVGSLCSQQFLEAYPVEAHFVVFGMCISYVLYIPIMQDEVCRDSQQLLVL